MKSLSSSPTIRAVLIVRAIMATLGALLALIGVIALAWVLVDATAGTDIAPLAIGLVLWCLPWAFVLLAGVIIASLVVRRLPSDSAHSPQ